MTRIVKQYDNELISMVALNCDDTMFKDFPKIVYADVISKTQQKLAKNYDLLERIYTKTLTSSDDLTSPIQLSITDFRSENKVTINSIRYKKKNATPTSETPTNEHTTTRTEADAFKETQEEYTYTIYYEEDPNSTHTYVWYIDYPNKAADDVIQVYYNSINTDLGNETGNIIIPEKYVDEVIRRATLTIGKLGIVKFQGEKKDKYLTIIRTYGRQSVREKQELESNTAWIHMKPYTIF